MDARSQVARIESETLPYEAAPDLYRVLEEMAVYRRNMDAINKYVLAIDPGRLDIDFEFNTIDPLTSIYDALGDQDAEGQEQP